MTTSSTGKRCRQLGAVAVCMAVLLVAAACTDSDFSLSEEDAYGTWSAGSGLPTTLELADDGTFQATAWPIDVGCSGSPPWAASKLLESETIDFTGTWEEGDEASQNRISLMPESEACGTPQISADFRSEDGVLYTCTLLGVHVDLARAENWFILYLGEPEATPDSSRCFNYN